MNLDCPLVILSALKFLGLCPIRRDNSTGQYAFLWSATNITFAAVWSILVATLVFFVHLIYFTHVTLGIYLIFGPGIHYTGTATVQNLRGSNKLTEGQIEANRICFKIIMGLVCSQFFFYFAASLRNGHKLPQLLNQWTNIHLRLNAMGLHAEKASDDTKGRARIFLISGAIIGAGALVGLLPTLTFIAAAPNHPDRALEIFINAVICMYTGLGEVLHDAVMVLMCKELRNSFLQVQKVFKSIRTGGKKHSGEAAVDMWCKLVLEIRKQGALLSEYLTPGQLPSLCQTLSMIILTVFSLSTVWTGTWVSSGGKPEHGMMVLTNLLSVGFLLMRLYLKFSVAQEITNAEALLASETMADYFYGDSLPDGTGVKGKLQELLHVINQKPCEINLADLVTLRRSLFLSVLGQIATYLIVITQFYDSK